MSQLKHYLQTKQAISSVEDFYDENVRKPLHGFPAGAHPNAELSLHNSALINARNDKLTSSPLLDYLKNTAIGAGIGGVAGHVGGRALAAGYKHHQPPAPQITSALRNIGAVTGGAMGAVKTHQEREAADALRDPQELARIVGRKRLEQQILSVPGNA